MEKTLADMIKRTAAYHEASWCGDEGAYQTSLQNAAIRCCGAMSEPVYYLLRYAWNDSLAWAECVLTKSEPR